MNKNTSIVLIAAVAGIMVAGALAVTMTTVAFADNAQAKEHKDRISETATGGNGGIGGAGGAGGVAGNGGTNKVEHAGGHYRSEMLMAEMLMAVMAEMPTAVTLATTNVAQIAN